MSFNQMSNQKPTSSADKPEDKAKAAPAVDAPEATPAKLPEEVEPSPKS